MTPPPPLRLVGRRSGDFGETFAAVARVTATTKVTYSPTDSASRGGRGGSVVLADYFLAVYADGVSFKLLLLTHNPSLSLPALPMLMTMMMMSEGLMIEWKCRRHTARVS